MDFVSTRGLSPPSGLKQALLRGLAPDGGLFMPAEIPLLSPADLAGLPNGAWPDSALKVSQILFSGAIAEDATESIVREALNFPVPCVQLGERIFVLELFHGPTLAFKDVGARFLSRLLSHFRDDDDPLTTVLTATSGDTGGAVAQAFHGLQGMRVVVLFPAGKITHRQECQFSTLGGNVTAVAVQGDFDDCQRLAKEAFRQAAVGSRLTSANSINLGRFLPQTSYFIDIWARLQDSFQNRRQILFSVPSGNFGNLAAGLLAKCMGLPGVSFLAATNVNDVFPEYLRTGRLNPRPSKRTLSTAMDVGNPSNVDRIFHLYGHKLNELKRDLVGRVVTDAETQACIRRVYLETGYVLDPHSAVGFTALERELAERAGTTGVLLATAHPAKFAEVVEPIIGEALPVPEELSRCIKRERRVIPIDPTLESLRGVL